MYGQNILNITHPDDQETLRKHLIPTDLQTLFETSTSSSTLPTASAASITGLEDNGDCGGSESNGNHRTQEEEDEIDRKLSEDKRKFTIRLARAGPRSEPITYEQVRIDGCFRRADSAARGHRLNSSTTSGLQLIRRARGSRDDNIPLHTINGNDIVSGCSTISRQCNSNTSI